MSEPIGFSPGDRHPSLSLLDAYWSDGQVARLPLGGEPRCEIVIDPKQNQLRLELPAEGAEPDLARFRNLDLSTFTDDGAVWWEIRVAVNEHLHEGYYLLTRVADLVQLDGLPISIAVDDALEAYKSLLSARGLMSAEVVVGLFGELLLLEHLLGEMDPHAAVQAWYGPLSEEHDVAFSEVHFEVKTTTSEHRRHMISGTQQLQVLRGIPLWLISVQVTPSAPDGGRTLGRLISDVRKLVGPARTAFDERLGFVGWRDADAELYREHYTLRSQPRAYLVTDAFPHLTDERLEIATRYAELISDVRYRIDVTHVGHSLPPSPVDGFVQAPKGDANV